MCLGGNTWACCYPAPWEFHIAWTEWQIVILASSLLCPKGSVITTIPSLPSNPGITAWRYGRDKCSVWVQQCVHASWWCWKKQEGKLWGTGRLRRKIYVSAVWQKKLHRTLRPMLSVPVPLKIMLWKLQPSPKAAEETELKQLLAGQLPEEQIVGRDPERAPTAQPQGQGWALRSALPLQLRREAAGPHPTGSAARPGLLPRRPQGRAPAPAACGGASPQGSRRRGACTGARVQACTGGRARTQPRRVHGSTGAHGEARSPRPQPSPWSERSSGCPGRGRWGRRGGSPASPSGRSRPAAGRCSIAAAARRCRRTLRSSCTPAPRRAAPARPPSPGGRAAGTQHPVSPSGPAAAVPAGREGLAAPPPPGAARAEAPLTAAAAARPPRGPRGPRPAAGHRAAPRLPPGPAGPRAARPYSAGGSASDGPQGTREKAGPEQRGCSQPRPRPGLPHAPKLARKVFARSACGRRGTASPMLPSQGPCMWWLCSPWSRVWTHIPYWCEIKQRCMAVWLDFKYFYKLRAFCLCCLTTVHWKMILSIHHNLNCMLVWVFLKNIPILSFSTNIYNLENGTLIKKSASRGNWTIISSRFPTLSLVPSSQSLQLTQGAEHAQFPARRITTFSPCSAHVPQWDAVSPRLGEALGQDPSL